MLGIERVGCRHDLRVEEVPNRGDDLKASGAEGDVLPEIEIELLEGGASQVAAGAEELLAVGEGGPDKILREAGAEFVRVAKLHRPGQAPVSVRPDVVARVVGQGAVSVDAMDREVEVGAEPLRILDVSPADAV